MKIPKESHVFIRALRIEKSFSASLLIDAFRGVELAPPVDR